MSAILLVLSSPSGGGKTSIARRLLERRNDVGYSVSATTRPARPGEVDGRDYHFLGRDEFQRRVDGGQFLEWAEYGGHHYGTLRAVVEEQLAAGRHVVLDIEVEGARQVRRALPSSVHVFVLPPSAQTLRGRLEGRRTESPDAIGRRLAIAASEIAAASEYDYVITNRVLEEAVATVSSILDAEQCRTGRQPALEERLAELADAVRTEAERARTAGAAS